MEPLNKKGGDRSFVRFPPAKQIRSNPLEYLDIFFYIMFYIFINDLKLGYICLLFDDALDED